jgi:hypothetical protein
MADEAEEPTPFWLSPFPFREPDWPPPDETEDG